jgi:hypothetical protein
MTDQEIKKVHAVEHIVGGMRGGRTKDYIEKLSAEVDKIATNRTVEAAINIVAKLRGGHVPWTEAVKELEKLRRV